MSTTDVNQKAETAANTPEPDYGLFLSRNEAATVDFTENHLVIATQDGRVIHIPLTWYPWLASATPEQRADFEIFGATIQWNELDDGVSMQTVLLGRHGK